MRAQAVVPSAQRSDTPKQFRASDSLLDRRVLLFPFPPASSRLAAIDRRSSLWGTNCLDALEDVAVRVAKEAGERRRPLRLEQFRPVCPQPPLQPVKLRPREGDCDVPSKLRL